MPNFKRFLSGIMALVLTLSMFSCLGTVVANADYYGTSGSQTVYGPMSGDTGPLIRKDYTNSDGQLITGEEANTWRGLRAGASDWCKEMTREEFETFNSKYQDYANGFGIKTYVDLNNYYKASNAKFLYIGLEIYEEDANGNLVLTDHKVKYGQKLTVKYYLKSNVYVCNYTQDTNFTRTFFDINADMDLSKGLHTAYYDTAKGAKTGDNLNNTGYFSQKAVQRDNTSKIGREMLDDDGKEIGEITITGNPCATIFQYNDEYTSMNSTSNKFDLIRILFDVPVNATTGIKSSGTYSNTAVFSYTIKVRDQLEASKKAKEYTTLDVLLDENGNEMEDEETGDPIYESIEDNLKYDKAQATHVGDIGEIGTDFHYSVNYNDENVFNKFYITTTSVDKGNAVPANSNNVILDTRDMNHTFRLYGTEYTYVNDDGSTVVTSQEYEPDAAVTAPTETPKSTVDSSLKFLGWDYNGDGKYDAATDVPPTTAGSEDKTVTAIYGEAGGETETKYTITWVDGTTSTPVEYAEGDTVEIPTLTAPTGYTAKWVYSTALTDGTKMPATAVTATATYTAIDYTITFTLDGEKLADYSKTYHYGDTVTIPTIEDKEGCTTPTWSYDVALIDGTKMPASNVNATANYTTNSYDVIFYQQDGKTAAQTLKDQAYGTTITVPQAPTVENMTFKYWVNNNDSSQKLNAGDQLTVKEASSWTAYYEGTPYDLTFKIELADVGVVYENKVSVPYGANMEDYAPTADTYKAAVKQHRGDTADFDDCYTVTSNWALDKMPNKATTLTMSIACKEYTLKFLEAENGKEYYNAKVKYHSGISDITTAATAAAQARTGYTFTSWDKDVPSTMPASDLTITGCFTVNTYDVMFWLANGTTTANKVEGVEYNKAISTVGSAPTPTYTGYDFQGWALADANGEYTDNGKIVYNANTINDAVITGTTYFKAVWKVHTYTITYKTNTAKAASWEDYTSGTFTTSEATAYGSAVNYDFGATVETVAVPTATGYEYSAWTYEPALNEDGTMPASDVVATSTGKQLWYTDTFTQYDGTKETQHYVYGATINAPTVLHQDGYDNEKWSPAPNTQEAKDMTFTYSSAAGSSTYKVQIYLQNIDDDEYTMTESTETGLTGNTATYTANTKTGFTLNEGTSKLSGTITADNSLTLKAYYDRNKYNVYLTDDANTKTAVAFKYGQAIKIDAPTAREGYDVVWTYATEAGSAITTLPAAMGTYDIYATAKYTVKSYTLKYIVDNEVIESTPVNFGTEVTLKTVEDTVGHKFSGWKSDDVTLSGDSFKMPAKDVTLTGTQDIQQYTITFDPNGGTFSDGKATQSITADYGTAVDMTQFDALLSKEGYTFKSWDYTFDAMPAYNITVKAQYNVNQYTAKFVYSDTEYVNVPTDFGAAIKAPTAKTKIGYTFTGWKDESSNILSADQVAEIKMTTAGATFTAVYTANKYTANFYSENVLVAHQDDVEFDTATITEPDVTLTRAGYNFKGWKVSGDSSNTIVTFPYTMKSEGISFDAVWEQDTTSLNIESIALATSDPYYAKAERTWNITLKNGYDAFSIHIYRGNGDWYEFSKAAFYKYGAESSQINSISKDDSGRWVWNVNMLLPAANDTYYAYITLDDGTITDTLKYNFNVAYDEKPAETVKTEFDSATISAKEVVRGNSLTWTVVTSKDVTWLRFDYSYTTSTATKNYSIYYKGENADGTKLTRTESGDKATWTIVMPFTYAGTDNKVEQTFNVCYRVGTDATYYTGASDIKVTVGYNAASLIATPDGVQAYTLVSVTAPTTAVKVGKKANYVVVKTTEDCTKLRIGYLNSKTNKMKYATYQSTSAGTTVTTADGYKTWQIAFVAKDATDYTVQARGLDWGDAKSFTLNITK